MRPAVLEFKAACFCFDTQVKWKKQVFKMTIDASKGASGLRSRLEKLTRVPAFRQKLLCQVRRPRGVSLRRQCTRTSETRGGVSLRRQCTLTSEPRGGHRTDRQ